MSLVTPKACSKRLLSTKAPHYSRPLCSTLLKPRCLTQRAPFKSGIKHKFKLFSRMASRPAVTLLWFSNMIYMIKILGNGLMYFRINVYIIMFHELLLFRSITGKNKCDFSTFIHIYILKLRTACTVTLCFKYYLPLRTIYICQAQ